MSSNTSQDPTLGCLEEIYQYITSIAEEDLSSSCEKQRDCVTAIIVATLDLVKPFVVDRQHGQSTRRSLKDIGETTAALQLLDYPPPEPGEVDFTMAEDRSAPSAKRKARKRASSGSDEHAGSGVGGGEGVKRTRKGAARGDDTRAGASPGEGGDAEPQSRPKRHNYDALHGVRKFWHERKTRFRWDKEFFLLVEEDEVDITRAHRLVQYAFTITESRTSHQLAVEALAASAVCRSDDLEGPITYLLDGLVLDEVPNSAPNGSMPMPDIRALAKVESIYRGSLPECIARAELDDDRLTQFEVLVSIRKRLLQWQTYVLKRDLMKLVAVELGHTAESKAVQTEANRRIEREYSVEYQRRFKMQPTPKALTRMHTRVKNNTLKGRKWATLVDAAGGDEIALTLLVNPSVPDSVLTDMRLDDWRRLVASIDRISPPRGLDGASYMTAIARQMRSLIKQRIARGRLPEQPRPSQQPSGFVDDAFLWEKPEKPFSWSGVHIGWVEDTDSDEGREFDEEVHADMSLARSIANGNGVSAVLDSDEGSAGSARTDRQTNQGLADSGNALVPEARQGNDTTGQKEPAPPTQSAHSSRNGPPVANNAPAKRKTRRLVQRKLLNHPRTWSRDAPGTATHSTREDPIDISTDGDNGDKSDEL